MAGLAQSLPRDFVLLAPAGAALPKRFREAVSDPLCHRGLLHSAQKFRGAVYLSDGAIDPWQLLPDGRHVQAIDEKSWHILSLDERGKLCGCVRYHPQPRPRFYQLGVREAAIASSPYWGPVLRMAIEDELAAAARKSVDYAEVGGWAIGPERRCTADALRMALSTYAIARVLGGSRGITTATVRHHSSSILRRIGGRPLQVGDVEVPSYYDARYRCDMEILRFDSEAPGRPYRAFVDELTDLIARVPVIGAVTPVELEQVPALGHRTPAAVLAEYATA